MGVDSTKLESWARDDLCWCSYLFWFWDQGAVRFKISGFYCRRRVPLVSLLGIGSLVWGTYPEFLGTSTLRVHEPGFFLLV